MPFEYVIYIMLFVAFLYGLYRGIKKETTYFISYTASFALVYFYIAPFLLEIDAIVDVLDQAKSYIYVFFEFTKINPFIVDFLVVYILPFLIILGILNLIFKCLFFKKKNYLYEKKGFFQRVFGALLGILVGIQAVVFMMVILNACCVVNFDSYISQLIIKYLPNIVTILEESACMLG